MELELEPRNRWRLGWGPGAGEGADEDIIRTPCSLNEGRFILQSSLRCCLKDWGVDVEQAKQQVSTVPLMKDFSLKRDSFKPMVSSFSDSNNWDSHSTQLSSLAYSPVLTPYKFSLPNLPSGGPASLSALWGPHRLSGLCCGGVCCVPLDDEIRLPSGHKLTGPAPG